MTDTADGNEPIGDQSAEPVGWEFFQDDSYYDMWCVRRVGESKFGQGFHLISGEEARDLAKLLAANSSNANAVARDGKDFAIEFGGYLANTADNFMHYLNEHEIAVDQDQWRALGSAIYEFRKRAEQVATAQSHARQPVAQSKPQEVLERAAQIADFLASGQAIEINGEQFHLGSMQSNPCDAQRATARAIASTIRYIAASIEPPPPDAHGTEPSKPEAVMPLTVEELDVLQFGRVLHTRSAGSDTEARKPDSPCATSAAAQSLPSEEEIARALYNCERQRGELARDLMSKASGNDCAGILIDPWDECKETFLSDASAVLALFANHSLTGDSDLPNENKV